MGILESLFGGGDSDPYALYGDLFTPQQKAALQARDQSQGLLRMAGAFAKAGMPSRLPVPMGAVLGSAAEALGAGSDENVQNAMRAMLYGAQAKKLQTEQQFLKDFAASQPEFLKTVSGILGTGAAAPTAPAAASPATPAGPLAAPAPAAAARTGPLAPAAAITPASFGGTVGPLAAAIPPAGAAAPPWASDPAGRGLRPAAGIDPDAQQQALELFKREAFGGDTSIDTPSSPGVDVLLSSGTPRPTLPTRSIADTGGGPLAPPSAPAADPRAAQMQALMLAIAQRRAMAVLGGIKDPYGPLMDAITESPAFKGLVAGAQEAGKLPYAGPTAGAVRGAQQPYILDEQAKKAALDRINDLFKQGMLWDPKLGAMKMPGYGRVLEENEAAKARGTASTQTTDLTTVGPTGPVKTPMTQLDKSRLLGGEAVPYLGALPYGATPAAPAPAAPIVPGGLSSGGAGGRLPTSAAPGGGPPLGSIYQEPVLTPEQTATQTARGQASVNVNPYAFNLTPDLAMLPKGPGTTEPKTLANGVVLPPAASATPIVGGADYLKKRQEQLADAENEWGKGIAPGAQAEQRLIAISDALKQFQSGAFAGNLADIRAKLGAVGIRLPESVAGDPAEAQKILKNNFAASIELMRSTGLSRWTQAELFGAQQNMANPNLQPEANQAIIAEAVGAIRWERAMKESWAEAKKYGWRDPHDFQLQWVQANPLQRYVEKVREDIGPLKGMAQPVSPGTVLPPAGARERRWNPATQSLE